MMLWARLFGHPAPTEAEPAASRYLYDAGCTGARSLARSTLAPGVHPQVAAEAGAAAANYLRSLEPPEPVREWLLDQFILACETSGSTSDLAALIKVVELLPMADRQWFDDQVEAI